MAKRPRSRDSPWDAPFEFTEKHFLTIIILGFLIGLIIMIVKADVSSDTEELEARIETIEQSLGIERR